MSLGSGWRTALRSRTTGRRQQASDSIDGRVEAVINGSVVGWAWDSSEPTGRITVAIEVSGEIVAEGTADVPRKDLTEGRIGDGAHGFSLPLPEALQKRDHVRLVGLAGPEGVAIKGATSFKQAAGRASPWGSVRFSYGSSGGQGGSEESPVEVPPPPQQVRLSALVGPDGWLFDARELDSETEPSSGALQRLAARLNGFAAAFAALGVTYVPACVPEKRQAVADSAPVPCDPTRPWLTDLAALLRDTDDCEVLDLLPIVKDAMRHGRCYQRSDADWNDRAAFFVVRALIKEGRKRSPEIGQLPMAALHVVKRHGYRGVLADGAKLQLEGDRWLPAEIDVPSEEGVATDAAHLRAQRMPVERHLVGNGQVHVRLMVQPEAGRGPRISIIGDEACVPLVPWFSQTAARTTFFWASTPLMDPIELELPNVVFHLIRYRDLGALSVDTDGGS